jgi:sugar/nucleoside kinase (ribokinase family)
MIHESEGTEWDVVGVGANSVDYVYRLPAAPATEGQHAKLRIESHTVSCGGQVTTALCTAAAMGLRAKYIGTLGSDTNGFLMKAELGGGASTWATRSCVTATIRPACSVLRMRLHP